MQLSSNLKNNTWYLKSTNQNMLFPWIPCFAILRSLICNFLWLTTAYLTFNLLYKMFSHCPGMKSKILHSSFILEKYMPLRKALGSAFGCTFCWFFFYYSVPMKCYTAILWRQTEFNLKNLTLKYKILSEGIYNKA